jgi:peptide chain release factor subunit 1
LGDAKFFDPRLKEKVISVVDVSYGFTQGLQQAIELSAEALKDSELIAQKHLMSKFFEEIAIDSNKSCFGVDATMASLESGAVDTLIVWEELAAVRHVVQEKATGKNHIVYCSSPDASPLKQFDQEAVEIKDSMPLLDWLAENFHNFGAKMEIVQDATAEGSQFCRGFGGLGALLRYAYNATQEFEDVAENGDEDVWHENTKKQQSGDYQSDEDDVWGRSVYGSTTQTATETANGKQEMESLEEIF